jgi:hypothetical protein
MTKTMRSCVAAAALMLAAPLASYAQCPTGYAFTQIPGGGFQCTPIPSGPSSTPEIGASAGIGGLALMLCGAMMLRGRKKVFTTATATATAS